MTFAALYLIAFVLFLGIDYLGLSYIVKPVFERDIGHLLLDDLRILPAFAFYAFFVLGVTWFVSYPGTTGGKSLLWVFASAAFIGAMAYGTYEFTNLATLKDWTWTMVMTDLAWGTILTGTSAALSVLIVRLFQGAGTS